MAKAQRYNLTLSKLQFCSLVDTPAQPNAKTLLIKRAGKRDEITATARLAKLNDELGLAFFWAFTSTNKDGSPHHDLQGDAISTDFVKAAMDYMTEGGGAVDEMHTGDATDARVVFAMPLTPEIAAAYGVTTKQYGLMIAIKPTTDQLAKLKSGELNGVSIAGLGERVPVGKAGAAKRLLFSRVVKDSVLTSETDGHQHALVLDDPASYWFDYYSTSCQTAEGATEPHSHTWTFDAVTGAITIGADSGHTHTLPAGTVVPPDALAAWKALDAAQDAENAATATATPAAIEDENSDGIPMATTDEESSGKVSVVVVQARAPQNKSTRPAAVPHGASTTENIMANEQTDKTIADLTKRLERAERIAKMSGAQKVHFDILKGDDAEAFLAKTAKERDAEIAEVEKANEVVYTSKSTGRVFRKSDSRDVVEAFKLIDAQAETLSKRDEAIEKADIRKQALAVLGGMPGDDDTHDAIIGALRKGLTGEALTKALATLNGMRSTSTIGKSAPGVTGGAVTGGDPIAKFNTELATFAKAAGKTTVQAFESFCNTPEGAALYAESRRIQA